LDVKATLGEAVHEEFVHAGYLEKALKGKGAEPYDYNTLLAQMGMFNAFEALGETVDRHRDRRPIDETLFVDCHLFCVIIIFKP